MSGAGRGRFLIAGLMALSLSMGLGSGPASGAMASGPQTRAARSAAGHHVSTKTRVAASTAHARTPRLHVQVQPDRAALDSRTGPAATLTFTVNSTVDTNDVNPGDGICADSSGQCTLRAAIQEADAQPKGGSITINVPAGTYGLKLGMLRLTANNITISGALSSTTIISGNNTSTVIGISNTVQAHLSNLTITGGNAGAGNGGGLFNEGVTVLRQSMVLNNTAASGGGILNGTFGRLTLASSSVMSNSASSTILNSGHGGGIDSQGTLTVTGSTISGNSATDSSLNGGEGGGLYNSGALNVTRSTISRNSVTVDTISGGEGGGLYNAGTATLSSSTISGNSADARCCGDGAGLYNTGTLSLSNGTISGNRSYCHSRQCGNEGVAIYNAGTLALTGSTISANRVCCISGAGGIYTYGATATLTTTIVAGNGVDCSGTLTSGGYNLVGSGSGCGLTNGVNGDQVGSYYTPLDPHLGPLQNNGGPTETMAPQAGSSAIDAVPPSTCMLSTDQRGQPRPDAGDHGACDIGAVETHYGGAQPPVVTAINPSSGPYTGGTVVVVEGANLVGPALSATVRFGGVVASNVITDSAGTLITATAPATGGASIVDVTVQTSAGTSQRTPNDLFTYTADVLYVSPTGRDTNNCLTPSSACRTIGHAVAVAASGATINVAAGIYTETVTIPVSLTITGAGAGRTSVNGYGNGAVVTVNAGTVVTISGVTIQHGSNGSGLYNLGTLALTDSTLSDNYGGIVNVGILSVTNSTVSGNNAISSGGIDNSGTLTLTSSIVSGNRATGVSGGGISNNGTLSVSNSTISGNSAGGGIYNSPYGTASLTNSTISDNSGGIANDGRLTLTNSTVSGNYAYQAGGIYNTGTMTLTNSTISGNSATMTGGSTGIGGGIYNSYWGTMTLTATIVAGNTASNGNPDCYGTLASGGYNLIGIGDGCGLTNGVNGDQVGSSSTPIDPLLGPLANNGGPTQTMAPLAGSPAVDAVSPGKCTLSTDQRGQPRSDDGEHGACDIGAVETTYSGAQPPVVTAVNPSRGPYTGGTVVVLNGSNLVGPDLAATVMFGGVAASYVTADPSGTLITATAPATSAPGIVDVTVQTSAGTSAATPFDRYTYTAATLYVATSGSDSNGCITQSSPCRTIGRAVALASSGASISVGTGIYTETNTIPYSLTLAGAGAGSTILDGNKSSSVITVTTGTTVAISGVTIQDGSSSSNGGGILNDGVLSLTNSVLSHNDIGLHGNGGGIYNTGTLTLNNSTLRGNSATNSSSSGGGIYSTGIVTLSTSTLSNNSGGGIYNFGTMSVTTSTLSNNSGGGIYNFGTLSVTTSTLSGNNTGGDGGGILNDGTLTVTNSTLSGNSANSGGGIANDGTVTVTNSTLSGNSASYNDIGGEGGGIYNYGALALINSTLSGNSATTFRSGSGGEGGGIYNVNTAVLTLTATIVASDTAPTSGPDCSGPLTSGGYNLVGIGDGCGLTNGVNGDQVGSSSSPINPLLGPLANNGGPTQTMALLPGSPAIDSGGTSATGCPATDQRGMPRPDEAADNGACDIGAFETQPPPSLSVNPSSGVYQQSITLTGTNFAPIETVNIYGDSTSHRPLYSPTTDASGTFVLPTTADQGPYGRNTLIAVGQTSGLSATTTFTELPELLLAPSSGAAGATVTASGYGFGAGEPVNLYWGAPGGPLLGTSTSNGYGTVAGSSAITFTVPASAAAGTYAVYAMGQSSGAQASATFTVP